MNNTTSTNSNSASTTAENSTNVAVEKSPSAPPPTAPVNRTDALDIFKRHIPRILRHQLLSKLVDQYLYLDNREDVCITPDPSIERFHGSLLFVDISGFTVLSQKLGVEDLKTQINAYFKKIIDIIDKYDGEVVKFAGDALFIIWQTKTNVIGK